MGSERLRVAVLMGGRSGEHDVSLKSGLAALRELPVAEFDTFPVVIDRRGGWHFPATDAPTNTQGEGLRLPAGLDALLSRSPAVVFIAMHGPEGEDGKLQSVFELLDQPFTGSGSYASSLAMNKAAAKDVYRARGIPVAADLVLSRRDWREGRDAIVRRIRASFEAPYVLKTPRLGSSVGLHILPNGDDLPATLDELFELDAEVLVERYVNGRELTCGVLDAAAFGGTRPLPLVEITPLDEPFFNYHAKYVVGASREVCPAPVDDAVTSEVQRLGIEAHHALGCRGFSRTDFILGADGTIITLETNTIPGLTETSLLPQAAAAAGISFGELLAGMVRAARED